MMEKTINNVDNYNETDLAYIAGYIDGEGTFSVGKGFIEVQIANTHLPTLDWLRRLFGGSIARQNNRPENYKPAYSLRLRSRKAERLCKDILPYLDQKQEECRLLLRFQATMVYRGKEVPQEIKDIRQNIDTELRRLKRVEY